LRLHTKQNQLTGPISQEHIIHAITSRAVRQLREKNMQTYKTGEKPGNGIYKCTTCGQQVVLDATTDTLPPCPKCSGTTYTKVG
ncbi:zinc ribbon-containing protein, partial [Acetobacterium tundrae]